MAPKVEFRPVGGTNKVAQASSERGTKAGKAIYESVPDNLWTLQQHEEVMDNVFTWRKAAKNVLNCHHGAVAESPKPAETKPTVGPTIENAKNEVFARTTKASDKLFDSLYW